MKLIRLVLGILAIIPLTLLVSVISTPATYGEVLVEELAYFVVGTPISILNLWAWLEPEIIEGYLAQMKIWNRS